MLVAKLASPLYTAVIECVPADSADVVKEVQPALFRVTVPSVVVPSLKVMVPVGVPTAGATTLIVAVKVTDCPEVDGLSDETNAADTVPCWTVSVTVGDVVAIKLPSPL